MLKNIPFRKSRSVWTHLFCYNTTLSFSSLWTRTQRCSITIPHCHFLHCEQGPKGVLLQYHIVIFFTVNKDPKVFYYNTTLSFSSLWTRTQRCSITIPHCHFLHCEQGPKGVLLQYHIVIFFTVNKDPKVFYYNTT